MSINDKTSGQDAMNAREVTSLDRISLRSATSGRRSRVVIYPLIASLVMSGCTGGVPRGPQMANNANAQSDARYQYDSPLDRYRANHPATVAANASANGLGGRDYYREAQ